MVFTRERAHDVAVCPGNGEILHYSSVSEGSLSVSFTASPVSSSTSGSVSEGAAGSAVSALLFAAAAFSAAVLRLVEYTSRLGRGVGVVLRVVAGVERRAVRGYVYLVYVGIEAQGLLGYPGGGFRGHRRRGFFCFFCLFAIVVWCLMSV